MKHIKTYVVVALSLLSLPGIAQIMGNNANRTRDNLHPKRLFIGDKVDLNAFEWNNVRNYPGGKMKLSNFKGKYIILDFWTKGCSACIEAFPKLEKLQNQFKDNIQILLITKNKESELISLLKKSYYVKNTKLPLIVGDRVLATELFPHEQVPFHVWLDREGQVIATTYSSETNENNIYKLIAGKPLFNVAIKNEILSDPLSKEIENPQTSLLSIANGFIKKYIRYYAQAPMDGMKQDLITSSSRMFAFPSYSIFTNYIPGDLLPQAHIFQDSIGNPKGFKLFNNTIDELIERAYLYSDFNTQNIRISKIVTENNTDVLYRKTTDIPSKGDKLKRRYCYESALPQYSFLKAQLLLQYDIMRFFGVKGSVEEKPIKHVILIRLGTPEEKKIWMINQNIPKENYQWNKDNLYKGVLIKNKNFKALTTSFSSVNTENVIFKDETGFNKDEIRKSIHISLKCSLECTPENLPTLQKELAKYGLGLKEELRNVKVLVLKRTI